MAKYKVIIDNSTLGDFGTIVDDETLVALLLDIELLLACFVIEEATPTKSEKD